MRVCTLSLVLVLIHGCLSADIDSDKAAGAQALSESHFEQAVEIYTAAAQAYPQDGEIPYRLATALMGLDRLDQAAQQFALAGAAGFQPMGVAYRIARIEGRRGNKAEALRRVEEMAALGFPVPQLLEQEPDFDSIRSDPRYLAAFEQIQNNRFPCRDDEDKRKFDFWVSDWEVSSLNQPAGTSSVQSILGDCVVFENWESVAGTSGKSFNYYDAGEGHWRQIWVDDTGGVIEFTGQVRDGVMYYTAVTHDPETRAATLQKLTFTPNADGTVRQFWEQSVDDGASWTVAFDGLYVRKTD